MPTVGTKFLTLSDVATMTHDQKVMDLAEVLHQENGILDDIHYEECNNGTNHLSLQRTGLPTIAWRELNRGVQPSKSTKKKCTDTTGMMEGYSDVDEDICDLYGNATAYRKTEDIGFVEAMGQEATETLFYGDTNKDEKKYLGFTPRYSDTSVASGEMLVDGGGSENLCSIWLIGWGPNKIHGLYPKGSKAGLEINDKGKVQMNDPDNPGAIFYGYRTQFKWKPGLTVKDWRYAGRICNLNIKDLSTADLITLMITLAERVREEGNVKHAWYVPREVRTALRIAATNKTNVNLSLETFGGKKMVAFDGKPIRRIDALRKNEEAVSGTFVEG